MEFDGVVRGNVHMFAVDDTELALVEPACRDAEDNKFLALSHVAEVGILASSDEDLLIKHPWREVDIATPLDFYLAHRTRTRSFD